jgi:hypothetical protein
MTETKYDSVHCSLFTIYWTSDWLLSTGDHVDNIPRWHHQCPIVDRSCLPPAQNGPMYCLDLFFNMFQQIQQQIQLIGADKSLKIKKL